MNKISRRDFLKSIATIAAVVGVPVDLIDSVTRLAETTPDAPITPDNPLGYIRINNLSAPIGYLEVLRASMGPERMYTPHGSKPSVFQHVATISDKSPSRIIEFGTNSGRFYRLVGQNISFTVSHHAMPFEIRGTGHITRADYEGGLVEEEGKVFNYTYTIEGQLEDYK